MVTYVELDSTIVEDYSDVVCEFAGMTSSLALEAFELSLSSLSDLLILAPKIKRIITKTINPAFLALNQKNGAPAIKPMTKATVGR